MTETLGQKISRLKELHEKANYNLLPLEVVSGDGAKWSNPHAQQMINTSYSWGVTQTERSQHKIRSSIAIFNEVKTMMEVIIELERALDAAEKHIEHLDGTQTC